MAAGGITQDAVDDFVVVRARRRFAPSPPPPPPLRRASSTRRPRRPPLTRVRPRVASLPPTPSRNPQAARYGDLEDVQSYLSQGVSVDATDAEGRTALFFAAANGHATWTFCSPRTRTRTWQTSRADGVALGVRQRPRGVVAKLLEAGAKATLVNAGGRTALDEANARDRQACVDAIMNASGVEEEEAAFEDDVEVEGKSRGPGPGNRGGQMNVAGDARVDGMSCLTNVVLRRSYSSSLLVTYQPRFARASHRLVAFRRTSHQSRHHSRALTSPR